MERKRLGQHLGWLSAIHTQLESFLSASASRFANGIARFVNDGVADLRARSNKVIAAALVNLELDGKCIVELLLTAERCGTVCTANSEVQDSLHSMPQVPGINPSNVQSKNSVLSISVVLSV